MHLFYLNQIYQMSGCIIVIIQVESLTPYIALNLILLQYNLLSSENHKTAGIKY